MSPLAAREFTGFSYSPFVAWLLAAATAQLATVADANLHHQGSRFLSARASEHSAADLLEQLEQLTRPDVADVDPKALVSSRVDRLEEALTPLYRIAPKDPSGRLSSTAARYVLHRLFSQRHGWFVNGIHLHGGYYNTSRVGEALRSAQHYTLRQLARFAATLEALVHTENVERLQRAFSELGFSRKQRRTSDHATQAINAYMLFFVTPEKPNASLKELERYNGATMPSWPDTKVFAAEVQRTVAEEEEAFGREEPLPLWHFCLRVVEEIGERYGRWQNKDCMDMKGQLLEMETPGTGRVPLEQFWADVLEKRRGWYFSESIPYMRQIDALYEAGAPQLSVMIPNYLAAPGNCLASSKYYDVCCINECDALLGEFESRIGQSEATPEQLAKLMETVPSSTVETPRQLPSGLFTRLEDLAERHGGLVTLHSRLFFQLLHHAYPRECPYPKSSLTQNVDRDAAWLQRSEQGMTATTDQVLAYLRAIAEPQVSPSSAAEPAERATAAASAELPWSDEEELFLQDTFGAPESPAAGVMGMAPSALAGGLLVLALLALVAARAVASPLAAAACATKGRPTCEASRISFRI